MIFSSFWTSTRNLIEAVTVVTQEQQQAKSTSSAQLAELLLLLQTDLSSALAAMVSNFEAIPAAYLANDREALRRSGLKAARRIESINRMLAMLARDSIGTSSPLLIPYSIQSLTQEAILYAIAQAPGFSAIESRPSLDRSDFIIRADVPRLVALLAALVVVVSHHVEERRVQLSLALDEHDDLVRSTWKITLDPKTPAVDWRPIVDSKSEQATSDALLQLYGRYWRLLASSIGASVFSEGLPDGIAVTLDLPLVRRCPVTDEYPQPQSVTVLMTESPPAGFVPVPAKALIAPPDIALDDYIRDSQAQVLVLHQPLNDHSAVSRNIASSSQVDIPVLLRAASLTHDQFIRYRERVDSIFLEPSDPLALQRYLAGLALPNRRSTRRPAEIH